MHELMPAKDTTLAQGLQETLEPITKSQVSPSPLLLMSHSAQEFERQRVCHQLPKSGAGNTEVQLSLDGAQS